MIMRCLKGVTELNMKTAGRCWGSKISGLLCCWCLIANLTGNGTITWYCGRLAKDRYQLKRFINLEIISKNCLLRLAEPGRLEVAIWQGPDPDFMKQIPTILYL